MKNLERYLDVSQRRLQALLERLKQSSQRLSRWRLGCFVLSFIGWLLGIESGHGLLGWGMGMLGAGLFIWLVLKHQGVRRQQFRVQKSIQLKRQHRARLALDWSGIPELPPAVALSGHPFEIDLDITGPYSLLRLLDCSLTLEGRQRLSDWLLALEPDPAAIARRQRLVQELREQVVFRDGLQLALAESAAQFRLVTDSHKPWQSAELLELFESLPSRRLGLSLAVLSVMAGLNLLVYGLSQLQLLPIWVWQIGISVYLLSFWSQRQQIQSLFKEAQPLQYSLARLRDVSGYLEKRLPAMGPALREQLAAFGGADAPSALLKGLGRIVGAASLQGNPLVWVMFNFLLPWDYYFAWRLEQLKPRLKAALPLWLERLWELEALVSLAHYAWLHPEADFADLQAQGLQIKGLGHPMIAPQSKVRNDFELQHPGQAFLITGSNMAGKSTFLKSLGLNLVLAQAGTVVDAESFACSPMRLFTCIRVTDSVNDGLSYFYTEVLRLKALLEAIESPHPAPVLFLVDEIFKGTNNRERLIGSRAYIQALTGKNALGGISSHDLELVQLAEQNPLLTNYHFRERIENGQMRFDFKLQPGPCPTTNALKIMALAGLPVEEPLA